jgi:hypothetical protein
MDVAEEPKTWILRSCIELMCAVLGGTVRVKVCNTRKDDRNEP